MEVHLTHIRAPVAGADTAFTVTYIREEEDQVLEQVAFATLVEVIAEQEAAITKA